MSDNTMLCEGGCGRSIRIYARLCRRCSGAAVAARPDANMKKSAAMKRLFKDDSFRDRHVERCTTALRDRLAADPALREKRRVAGQRLAKSGTGHEARYLGWCPEHMRPAYRALVDGGMKRAEARAEIENRISAARANRGRRLSFEEQLEAVRNGARLVRAFSPIKEAGPYTLGGVASGMI